MFNRFELRNCGERFFFILRPAGSCDIILTSELYASKAEALDAIETARENAAMDRCYRRKISDSSKLPFFVLCAADGAVLATSEVYASAFQRNRAIADLKASARHAVVKDETQPRARRLAATDHARSLGDASGRPPVRQRRAG